MQELLEFIVKKIVNNPESVSISKHEEEDGTIRFHITVDPEDAGLVIGKGGKVINAIRNIVRIQAIKQNKRVYLDLTNQKEESSSESPTEEE